MDPHNDFDKHDRPPCDIAPATNVDRAQLLETIRQQASDLRAVDMVLDRRDALADIPNRVDKILACIRALHATDPKAELVKALARLSDAEATITELKAVVREFVHEFKGEDFEAGLWPMMDRANAALAPPSDATTRAESTEARCTALEAEIDRLQKFIALPMSDSERDATLLVIVADFVSHLRDEFQSTAMPVGAVAKAILAQFRDGVHGDR